MDKLDNSLKESAATVVPSENFVPATMHKVDQQAPRHRGWYRRPLMIGLTGAAAVLVAVTIIMAYPGTKAPAKVAQATTQTSGTSAAPASNTQGSTSAGTDNQSLTNDLDSANDSIGQSARDLQSSANALGDQQPTISD